MTPNICGNLCRFDKGEMGGRVDWREDLRSRISDLGSRISDLGSRISDLGDGRWEIGDCGSRGCTADLQLAVRVNDRSKSRSGMDPLRLGLRYHSVSGEMLHASRRPR
jgi:hypothetical protein